MSYPSTTKRIVLASEYQRKILEHLNSLVRFQTIDPKVMHRQHQRYLADQIECKNYLEASLLQLGIRTEIFTTPQSKKDNEFESSLLDDILKRQDKIMARLNADKLDYFDFRFSNIPRLTQREKLKPD